jgi:hypothetical protein
MASSRVKSTLTFCQLCGQKISGPGRTFHHKSWPRGVVLRVCQDCYQQKPRCRICDIPIAKISTGGEHSVNGLCTTCMGLNNLSLSKRLCLSCGRPVAGKYYQFDGVGPYCKDCYRKRPPCDVCGAPLTDEKWQLSDGRITCAHCHSTAIYSPQDAASLYEEMKKIVAQRLGLKLNVPTGLALVDRNQLREVIHRQANPGNPLNSESQQHDIVLELDPQRTLGIYARRGMRRGIYVQTGLPRMLFLQVATHEYAHAWQGENCPTLRDQRMHEGFAEWVAYHVMGYFRYSKGQERMLARNDIYGQGLRWALELDSRSGENGVIDACRRSIGGN